MTPLSRRSRVRTHIPPLDHTLRAARLQADQGLRLTNAWLGALRLLTDADAASTWSELWAIGGAALQQLVKLQSSWAKAWLEWLSYASQVDGATSFSKLNERECNIVLQAAQLFSEQSAALINLFETIEVDVSFRLSERGRPSPQPPA
jgi:hypothetical protein